MINWGVFYGVGVGPGDPELLTLRAQKILQQVDFLAIPKSRLERESVAWEIARPYCRQDAGIIELELPMTSERARLEAAWREGAQKILAHLEQGASVAFITLGDPSLYSTYSYLVDGLRALVPEECIRTVPGITAMSAAAALVNLPLAAGDEPLLVLPSAETAAAYQDFPNLVFLKVSRRLPELLATFEQSGRPAVLLTRVGQKGQTVRWQPQAADLGEEGIDYLSLMLVKGAKEEENSGR
ncbi:Precorrin-2 C(20)-methyltransferase domain protein [Acididesulfobacillus acetoxydans]|uniref:Precorrin-2 C(20)-methyltransferase domain protein n=1 Tax=Acididesulfobacillus acetoxydans TaxID=1561005 RepID=A0A8S0VXH3_9FIRM|nr:precorrin-2 C(20)-methyltransferase [Acididesulfobacillus acetoxydans]CAA7601903.1 Precorrin-2 C(20)-methyltransferase domain protein [Acididesulfobacillus acetoxydans]CEJ08253.1 Precorrin-2 C20-methyltransferase [Acididesulfobacillus acetoxydans]